MVALLPLRDDARFEPVEEVAFVCSQLRDGSDDFMQSADVIEQGGNGNQRSAEHQAGLNHRSEEHTSELQSPCNLVCRLLLEKKKIHRDQRVRDPWTDAYSQDR